MQLNTNALLALQPLDAVGSFAYGQQAGAMQQQRVREQEYRNALAQYGAAAGRGDQAALNALAGFEQFGPQASSQVQANHLGMDATRNQMRISEEMLQIARQEAQQAAQAQAADISAQEAQAALAEMEAAMESALMIQDPAQWAQFTQTQGFGDVPFEARDVLIAQFIGAAEVLDARAKQAEMAAGPEEPAAVRTRRILAQEAGLTPGTPEYQAFMSQASDGVNVTVNTGEQLPAPGGIIDVGTTPAGMVAISDPTTESGVRYIPGAGGPADMSAQQAARQSTEDTLTSVITNAARFALGANSDRLLTGLAGVGAAYLPSSSNAELYRQVEVLRSNATIESLNAMRRESPTGGALGNVTEAENRMLAARAGALDPASPNFERDLRSYTLTLLQVVHGNEEGTKVYNREFPDDARAVQQSAGSPGTPPPPPGSPAYRRLESYLRQGASIEDVWARLSPETRALLLSEGGL